jgi:peptidoglycan/xylan/chitin deacetylase (PgdA/CDA1 family)
MLTYRRTTIFFGLAMLTSLVVYVYTNTSWWILLPAPVLYMAVIAYGSAFIRANFYMPSICNHPTDEKVFALTFDDGPDPAYTLSILALLKKYDAQAAFFVIGKKIAGHEAIMQQLDKAGHLIGNHSYSHSYVYDFYSTAKVEQDLLQASEAIRLATGLTPCWFRPPYGVTNPNIAKAVRKLKYTSIGWDVRSLDTVVTDAGKLYDRVIRRIKPGSIVLFHDTHANTVEALEKVLIFARENNYKIVRPDKMLGLKAYEEI